MNNLRLIRKNLLLTQKEIAEELGIKQSTWSLYETGVITPSRAILFQLQNKYNIDPMYALGEKSQIMEIDNTSGERNDQIPIEEEVIKELLTLYQDLSPSNKKIVNDYILASIPLIKSLNC